MSRNPETGVSESVLISEDGEWEYAEKKDVVTDDEIRKILKDKGLKVQNRRNSNAGVAQQVEHFTCNEDVVDSISTVSSG